MKRPEVGSIIHVEQKTMNGTPYVPATVVEITEGGSIRAQVSAAVKIRKRYFIAGEIVPIPSDLIVKPKRGAR